MRPQQQIPQGWMQTPHCPPQSHVSTPPQYHQQPPQQWQQLSQGGTRPGQTGYTPHQRFAWITIAVALAFFTLSGRFTHTAPNAPSAPTQPGPMIQAPPQQAPDPSQAMAAVARPITQFIDGVQNGDGNQALGAWDESRRAQMTMPVRALITNVQQNGGVVYGNRNIDLKAPPTGGRCVALVTYTAQFPNNVNPVRQTYTLVQRGDQWFIERLD